MNIATGQMIEKANNWLRPLCSGISSTVKSCTSWFLSPFKRPETSEPPSLSILDSTVIQNQPQSSIDGASSTKETNQTVPKLPEETLHISISIVNTPSETAEAASPRRVTETGGGNAETPEAVIKIPGKVISSFQFVAAQEHVIDFYEQMPETKKIIPVIRFSNEATDPPAKLNEIVIGITGQAAFSIMGYALTGSSSSPASYFVVGATVIGFICTLIALTLKGTKKPEARILGKVGAMAAACAVIVAMGMFLPANTIWTTGIACVIALVAVALA